MQRMQLLLAKGTSGSAYTCFFYERLGLPPGFPSAYMATAGLGGKVGAAEFLYSSLPGASGTNADIIALAASSGGNLLINQTSRPGTWCFTTEAACAAGSSGCSSVLPPMTAAEANVSCSAPNTIARIATDGGAAGNTSYADGTCVCAPGGFTLRLGNDIMVDGCSPTSSALQHNCDTVVAPAGLLAVLHERTAFRLTETPARALPPRRLQPHRMPRRQHRVLPAGRLTCVPMHAWLARRAGREHQPPRLHQRH